MKEPVIFPAITSGALGYAVGRLQSRGVRIVDTPSDEVTHLLLPVPCRVSAEPYLSRLPSNVVAIGGGLELPNSIDLLKDEGYLAKNAMITAHIAVGLAVSRLNVILPGCPVLILGWGRIGKCLSSLLQAMGAEVAVAARKPWDRAMAEALGMQSYDIAGLQHCLRRFRVIFNTVPAPLLNREQLAFCRQDCLKLELASVSGMEGDDVLVARGLPGKFAPESSGNLIADTILRLWAERTGTL